MTPHIMNRSKQTSGRGFRRVRGLMEAALVFVVAVSLAACTDRPATEDEFGADTTMMGDTTGLMSPSPGFAEMEDTVTVDLASLEADIPQTLQSGETVFEVENSGSEEHGFEIELVSAEGMQGEGMQGEGMQDDGMEGQIEGESPTDGGLLGGDSDWSIESVGPGESETLAVNLQPGTYNVYCPEHRDTEEVTVRVQDNAGATTAQVY